MMDGQAELVLQRLHQYLGTVVERRVDAPLAVVARYLHPQVTRYGQQRGLTGGLVPPQDHDGVTAMTRHILFGSDPARVGRRRIDAGPAVGPDQQEVLDRRAAGAQVAADI